MKIILSVLTAMAFVLTVHAGKKLPKSCEVGGFALGCQAYTFNRFTAFEAIEKTHEAGGKTIEFFSWQKLSTNHGNLEVNQFLPEKQVAELKAKLKKEGIRASSIYFGNKAFEAKDPEAELRKVFEFARKMDMVALTGEPPESGLDLVEKLCKEYDLRFCLHNHRGSPDKPEYKYWNPDYTVPMMKNRDRRMGFCLDTGHVVRSGLNPLDALKKMEGRVFSLHLKDPVTANGEDTIYGKGVADIKGILAELKRQKFDGFISIEYENNWTNSVPDIKQCIEFVRANGRK